jgi:hypothetical protein
MPESDREFYAAWQARLLTGLIVITKVSEESLDMSPQETRGNFTVTIEKSVISCRHLNELGK